MNLVESRIIKQVFTLKNFFYNHILILALFIFLTGIFTFPSYFEIDNIIGIPDDGEDYVSYIWWYNYNLKNPSEPFNFNWLFVYEYQYYPFGAPIHAGGTFNILISILVYPFTGNFIHTYNIIVFLSFIFAGYGMFHLIKHLTKNYYASIIAGIIFSFGTYHTLHAFMGHLDLLAIQFIPLSVLYLFKTVESNKIKYPIIGGIFLFLSFISSFYIGFLQIFFFIPIFLYFLLTKRKLQTFIRITILLLVTAALLSPFIYGLFLANDDYESVGKSLKSFKVFSADLANFVVPTPNHTLTKIIDYPFQTSFGVRPEGWTFLGYTAIFLSVIGVLKSDKKEKTIWIISGSVLAIISLGPILKIGGIETGIHLPYYYLYELPIFDLWRSLGRAAVFTTFCVAILASYGINEIFKFKLFSKNKKLVIVAIIGIFVIIEALIIPYPSYAPHESEIFSKIASDSGNFVVLQAPMGVGETPITNSFLSNDYSFDQTIHEKPIYLGRQARVPDDTKEYFRTYFLNQFIGDQQPRDIVEQDLKEVGISLFDYFDVGYVIVYTDVSLPFPKGENPNVKKIWVPQTKSTLIDIFSKSPDFEDDRLFAYKIPEPTSEAPFIVLGDGWSGLKKDYVRRIGDYSEIKIINPSSETTEVALEIHFISLDENDVTVHFNGKEISKDFVEPNSSYRIVTPPLKLKPNENQLTLSFSPMSKLIKITGAVLLDDDITISTKAKVSKISINVDSKQFVIEKLY